MSSLTDDYYARAKELLSEAWSANASHLSHLAPILGASIANGGIVHTFGSGHSELIAREIVGRPGALACVTSIIDPTAGFVENLPGYGTQLIERYDRQYQLLAGEIVIVISNSGCTASSIEVALHAKRKGLIVVAVTSLAMSRLAPSQHSGGKRLFEIADHVLDNGGLAEDALVEVSDGVRAGPSSTLIGCAMLNWLMLATTDWLETAGHPSPILLSQHLPGAHARNLELAKKYQGRLSRPMV